MTIYHCNDGNALLEIKADSPKAAAQEYVDGGDWGDEPRTSWVNVHVHDPSDEDDDGESYKIQIDPPEPPCEKGQEHVWCSPHSVLGGLEENPGVRGHGGGVIIRTVCRHCAAYQIVDSWAQDPTTGEQGLESVEYREPDADSRAWAPGGDA